MTVKLEEYKNHRLSGVTRYAIGDDFIVVEFKSRSERIYLYNYSNPGADIVKRMKELALEGRGLNTYINHYVRGSYHKKGNSLESVIDAV